MKDEFKRFGLQKMGLAIIILEIVGATGLLVGIKFNVILLISSSGLALLMLAGVIVRIMAKDSVWITLPAFLYMALNAFIFWMSIELQS